MTQLLLGPLSTLLALQGRGLRLDQVLEPPVAPGRGLARELARRELSDPVYAKARPGLLQRLVQWLIEQVQSLDVPASALADPRTGVVLLVLLAGVVTVVVLRRTGRLRGPGRRGPQAGVFSGRPFTADEHRRLADDAAASARWDDAVRERFRAVARALEERVVLDERAGRTADEVASEAAAALPELAGALREGARRFDDVSSGGRPARAEHDAELRRLDDAVRSARLQGVG